MFQGRRAARFSFDQRRTPDKNGLKAVTGMILRNRRDELQVNERNLVSPSPLNGERAGVRGESVAKALILQGFGEECPPHLTLPSPLPPGAERECLCPPVGYPAVQAVRILFVVIVARQVCAITAQGAEEFRVPLMNETPKLDGRIDAKEWASSAGFVGATATHLYRVSGRKLPFLEAARDGVVRRRQ